MRTRLLTAALTVSTALGALNFVTADDSTLFARIDANADGKISAEEINAEGKPLYTRLLRVADKNHDGKLTPEEFESGLKAGAEKFEMSTTAMTPGGMPGGPPGGKPGSKPSGKPNNKPSEMMANPQQMLANIDRDKNGKISESEAPPRVKANFKQFDKDGDGELDKREMGAAMMTLRPGASPPGESKRPNQPKKKKE